MLKYRVFLKNGHSVTVKAEGYTTVHNEEIIRFLTVEPSEKPGLLTDSGVFNLNETIGFAIVEGETEAVRE